MNTSPKVSIITPTYNRPEYLQQTINSALAQTDGDFELIICDNHSSANPQAMIEALNDPRIRFFRHDRNIGMIANILYALNQAQGKYTAMLLDDDLWHPEFLAKLVPPLEADADLALTFCDHFVIDGAGEIDPIATQKYSESYHRANLAPGIHQPFHQLAMVNTAVSTATAAVMRRSLIDWQQISPEVGGALDSYLCYLYCREGLAAYYVPLKLSYYREHEATDTAQSGRQNANSKISRSSAEVFCYESYLADQRLQEFHPYFRQKLAHWLTTLSIGLMRNQQVRAARPHLWRSLQQQFHWRTAIALLLSLSPPAVASRF
jgi:glycosyltransferase involved in cell wall biosynthesis